MPENTQWQVPLIAKSPGLPFFAISAVAPRKAYFSVRAPARFAAKIRAAHSAKDYNLAKVHPAGGGTRNTNSRRHDS